MTRRRRFVLGVLLVVGALGAATRVGATPVNAPVIVTGQDAGWPEVRGWTSYGGDARRPGANGLSSIRFSAYDTYKDGVSVAVGDVDGNGKLDVVAAPTKSGWGEVRVFDGRTFRQLGAAVPYPNAVWWGGLHVAAGDVNGDGKADVVTGLDGGNCCTMVGVVDGATMKPVSGFQPYGQTSAGMRAAAADLNGDGKAELLVAGPGTGLVQAFAPDGGAPFRTLDVFAAPASVVVAAGDVLGTPRPEVVAATATPAGTVQLKIVDVQTGQTLQSLFPFGPASSAPEVAAADVDGDGHADVVASAQSAAGTQVKAFDPRTGTQLASFFVLEPGIVPGASLAAGDLDGDGKAEIVLGGGPTQAPWPPLANGPDQRVVVYHADGTLAGGFTAFDGLFQGGVRVALADLGGSRDAELVTAPGPGARPEIAVWAQTWSPTVDRGSRLAHFDAYEPTFRGGVDVATGDVLGRGTAQIVTAPGPGRPSDIRVFDANGAQLLSFRAFEDSYRGGVSVAVGDVDGNARADIVVGALAGQARVRVFTPDGTPFGPTAVPFPDVDRGVQVAVADLAGDGLGVVLAASSRGADPVLAVVDPAHGDVRRVLHPLPNGTAGLRIAAGDVDGDGRDEVVLTSGWGGGGIVQVLGPSLARRSSFQPYTYPDWGYDVAVLTRQGLPIRATGRTSTVVLRKRTRLVVARFEDAAGERVAPLSATIDWGDGTAWKGVVLTHGNVFDVRSTKRYAARGRYAVTVTLRDGAGRTSIARSVVVVRPFKS